ncbi:MAG TPA: methyltransferase domain-containing protein [Chloroflexota bacterium]|nr:methyltransferase domain-containing protein [Chloroflexota bacterium]
MSSRTTDPDYLQYQYSDAEKLRIRVQTHQQYTERPNDAFFAWVVSHLAPRAGMTVLDLGCGPGTYHPLLTRAVGPDGHLLALDRSPGMVQEARQRITDPARQPHGTGQVVSFLQADAEQLPLQDTACDRVLAAHMLYHVPDQRQALREMRRVLRPGGRLVLTTMAAAESRLHAIHCQAALELGYSPAPGPAARFSLDDLPLVWSVFPGAERHVFEDAFRFPTADAAL